MFFNWRNGTKRANFRGSPLFQATHNIKTEKQTFQIILCQLYVGSWRKTQVELFVFLLYLAWKRGLPRKFDVLSCFVQISAGSQLPFQVFLPFFLRPPPPKKKQQQQQTKQQQTNKKRKPNYVYPFFSGGGVFEFAYSFDQGAGVVRMPLKMWLNATQRAWAVVFSLALPYSKQFQMSQHSQW